MWALIESVIPGRRTPEIWKARFSTLQHFNHMLKQSKQLVHDKLISWGTECRDTNKGCVLSMKCHRIFQKDVHVTWLIEVTGTHQSRRTGGPSGRGSSMLLVEGLGTAALINRAPDTQGAHLFQGLCVSACTGMWGHARCSWQLCTRQRKSQHSGRSEQWRDMKATRSFSWSVEGDKLWFWEETFQLWEGYKRLLSGLGTEWQGTNLRQDMEAQIPCQRKGWRMINKLDARQTALLMVPFCLT